MTGWQSADSHNHPMCQENNEIVELSRIISQLAMANHQLASTHSATLARMEALYLELSKDREKQTISAENLEICEDVSQKRLQNENVENEEIRRLEQRVLRLEKLLATSSFGQCKQRCLQEDSKLCCKAERSENLLKTRDMKSENSCSGSAELCYESLEQRTNHIVIDAIGEVPDDCGDNQDTASKETDIHICCSAHSDDSETNIPILDEKLCSMNVDLDKVRRRRARLRDDDLIRNPASEEIFKYLSEKIETLKTDRLEFQNANKRLLCSLTDQKNLMEKLGVDYEVWRWFFLNFRGCRKTKSDYLYNLLQHLV